jgi:hypothetical protein
MCCNAISALNRPLGMDDRNCRIQWRPDDPCPRIIWRSSDTKSFSLVLLFLVFSTPPASAERRGWKFTPHHIILLRTIIREKETKWAVCFWLVVVEMRRSYRESHLDSFYSKSQSTAISRVWCQRLGLVRLGSRSRGNKLLSWASSSTNSMWFKPRWIW